MSLWPDTKAMGSSRPDTFLRLPASWNDSSADPCGTSIMAASKETVSAFCKASVGVVATTTSISRSAPVSHTDRKNRRSASTTRTFDLSV